MSVNEQVKADVKFSVALPEELIKSQTGFAAYMERIRIKLLSELDKPIEERETEPQGFGVAFIPRVLEIPPYTEDSVKK